MATLTVVLAIIVALGYFALAGIVLPRIELVDASPGFRKAFRIGGIAFFAGCGLTHTHIAVHAAENGDLVAPHEVAFHLFQAIGVWVFVYVAVHMIDVRVERRRTPAEQLEVQVAELSRSNEDLEQFAHVVSHDLQGPLRTASGFAELLARRHGDDLPAEARDQLLHLRDSHAQMQDILEGVLRYSRAAAEGLARDEVDLGEAVADVLRGLAGPIDESGAQIAIHGDLPVVLGDPVQLRQVLLNLIGNTLKFAGDRPPRVEISAVRHGDEWEIVVRDHGVGIEPGEAESIFEMFARGTRSAASAGSGIGLAICRKIVHRHGGTLRAEPADGAGAVFRFTLPAVAVATVA